MNKWIEQKSETGDLVFKRLKHVKNCDKILGYEVKAKFAYSHVFIEVNEAGKSNFHQTRFK